MRKRATSEHETYKRLQCVNTHGDTCHQCFRSCDDETEKRLGVQRSVLQPPQVSCWLPHNVSTGGDLLKFYLVNYISSRRPKLCPRVREQIEPPFNLLVVHWGLFIRPQSLFSFDQWHRLKSKLTVALTGPLLDYIRKVHQGLSEAAVWLAACRSSRHN